jgi:hypothetical protein
MIVFCCLDFQNLQRKLLISNRTTTNLREVVFLASTRTCPAPREDALFSVSAAQQYNKGIAEKRY